jgi:hypothetical protein
MVLEIDEQVEKKALQKALQKWKWQEQFVFS